MKKGRPERGGFSFDARFDARIGGKHGKNGVNGNRIKKAKALEPLKFQSFLSTPGRIRTCGLQSRSLKCA